MTGTEERDGVALTNLDQPLFDGAGATKRDLVDYLDAVHEQLLRELHDRPLSVMRVRVGQPPFMQKNTPKYAPDWLRTVTLWAFASRREIAYPICDDRRSLLWLANQRAVEYHPTLFRMSTVPRVAGTPGIPDSHSADDPGRPDAGSANALSGAHPAGPPPGAPHPTHLVLDLDPPEGDDFAHVVAAAMLVRQALADSGLAGAVKTSGSKGVHIIVPLAATVSAEDAAAATRALAARAARVDPSIATTAYIKNDREGKVFLDSTRSFGATVVAAYSPRIRPGVPVSFPVAWDDLASVHPTDFTIHTAPALLAGSDPWAAALPPPQDLPPDLVEEGHTIPVARVVAMHEGKRRKRAGQSPSAH